MAQLSVQQKYRERKTHLKTAISRFIFTRNSNFSTLSLNRLLVWWGEGYSVSSTLNDKVSMLIR